MISALVASCSEFNHVNEVLTLHMGPDYILVNISVDVINDIRAGELESAFSTLKSQILSNHPRVKRVFIEAGPAYVSLDSGCLK